MMSSRAVQSMMTMVTLALATGCAARGTPVTAPVASDVPASTRRIVSSSTGRAVSLAQLADAAAKVDVVFFGEQHDDEDTHRAELALLAAIGERKSKVVLSLEMFERDVQPLVDAYLAGTLSEAEFRAQSRPWPNYGTDYRPLVELAKANRWPVIASNVPRRLASAVSRRGLGALDSLPPEERAFAAKDIRCPTGDQYHRNFVEVMSGAHGGGAPGASGATPSMQGMMDQFYQAQCIKDETMAEAIVDARARAGTDAVVVHFTGAFHSDYALGTVSRVIRRIPAARPVVVTAVPTPDPAREDAAPYADRAQYVILALRVAP
ncbi:MAG TPA: ChaN family lipoprotein [Gemmatimonadaceae bacterium]|nr:ChaN family lipoprotein [Gemmatimonadaceae bacterium]